MRGEEATEDDPVFEQFNAKCPKCGTVYADQNRRICEVCSNKKGIIFRLLEYFKPFKLQLGVVLICLILSSVVSLVSPIISGQLLYDQVVDSGDYNVRRAYESDASVFHTEDEGFFADVANIWNTMTKKLYYYYTPDEIATYVEAWQKYRRLTSSQRKKLKADSYLGYRRYIKAASIYDEILDNQQDITDKVFLGNVYHNRGVAAANNMDVEDAKSYFMKAYELNGNEESLRSYLIVFSAGNDATTLKQEMRKFDLDEDNFENLMIEIGDSNEDVREMTIFSMLQRAVYNRMNKDMIDYDKRMDIILGQLKDEFREQAI